MAEIIDEKAHELDSYFDVLAKRGEKVPTRSYERMPSFRAISAASGIDLKYLSSEPLKQRINLAVNEIGLMPFEGTFESRRRAAFEKKCNLLKGYLSWLAENGINLPEDPKHKGRVFFQQVAIESGIGHWALCRSGRENPEAYNITLLKFIEEAAPRLGMEVRVLPQLPGREQPAITFGQLFEKGSEARKGELKGKSNADQQRYNTRWALNKLLRTLNLKMTDPVGDEFIGNFDDTVEKVAAKLESQDSVQKFRKEIGRWRDYYHCLIKESSIPEEFHPALRHVIDRSGLTISVLAKLIGACSLTLRGWYEGLTTPKAPGISLLSRMESLFKLLPGTLTLKLQYSCGRRYVVLSEVPEVLKNAGASASNIRRHLPDDFGELPEDKQAEIVESIRAEILRGNDPYVERVLALTKLPYRLKKWPSRLKKEFNALAEFKMGERAPLGMNRSGRWNEKTKEMREQGFAFLFGALSLSANAEDERVRGLGLRAEYLTIALLACPLVVDWFVRFRRVRGNPYTKASLNIFKQAESHLREKTGWLRQRPDLARWLRPLFVGETALVTPQMVLKARRDWDGFCDDALESYDELKREITPQITVSRDPFYRIEGIVDKDNPMEAEEVLLRGMKGDLPSPRLRPQQYHTGVRNYALIGLETVTGVRCGTLTQLDRYDDGSGHLYKEDGRYFLKIPRQFFKDPESSFFGPKNAKDEYYITEIPDEYDLYKMLDEYMGVSRPWLLTKFGNGSLERPLFVSTICSASIRLSSQRMSAIYFEATGAHLAENKWRGTGMARVRPHRIHSARHVRGTTIVKKTGSFRLAGDGNQNTERMAREHYTRFSTKDRNKLVNETLFGQ